MRGFYVGRFQPYHLGHQAVLQQIADEVEEIVVGIGSAQASHSPDNPFTAGERLTMIHSALKHLDTTCYVIPLPDIKRNAVWVAHVQSMTPQFDIVYSNNPLVVELFIEAGVEVRRPPMYRREDYSGTRIRKMMLDGGDWEKLVPKAVAEVIAEIKGIERLQSICKDDC
jgi:nicotinamide-nucleotide adenylyltransferase